MKKCQKLLSWNDILFLTQFPANLAAPRSQTLPKHIALLAAITAPQNYRRGWKGWKKIETEKDYNYFLNLVREIYFSTTSLQSKEDSDRFGFYFRRAGCSSFTKIRQDFNFYTLEKKKITEMFHMDAGKKHFCGFCCPSWWWPAACSQFSVGWGGLRHKHKLWPPNVATNNISGTKQLPLL